jgi:hypothetical protein
MARNKKTCKTRLARHFSPISPGDESTSALPRLRKNYLNKTNTLPLLLIVHNLSLSSKIPLRNCQGYFLHLSFYHALVEREGWPGVISWRKCSFKPLLIELGLRLKLRLKHCRRFKQLHLPAIRRAITLYKDWKWDPETRLVTASAEAWYELWSASGNFKVHIFLLTNQHRKSCRWLALEFTELLNELYATSIVTEEKVCHYY